MKQGRRFLVIGVVAVAAAVAGYGVNIWRRAGSQAEAAGAVMSARLTDLHGKALSIDQWRGRVLVVNFWATWCAPCRREMPTLDKLQGTLGGKDFEVMALSIDRAGVHAVEAFFMEIGVKHLRLYIDQSTAAMRKLAVVGLPTTLLIDREGREVWRYAGAAEWDSDEWMGEIRKAIEKKDQ